MTTVKVRSWAGVFPGDSEAADGSVEVTDADLLKQLHGQVLSNVPVAEYLPDGESGEASLYKLGVCGGTMILEYSSQSRRLYCVTSFTAPRSLTQGEIDTLTAYMTGQLMDGVGENSFETGAGNDLTVDVGCPPELIEVEQDG